MEKIRKYFEVFKAKVKDIYDAFPDNEDIKAVYAFYQQDHSFIVGAMQKDSLWDDIAKNLNKKLFYLFFPYRRGYENSGFEKGIDKFV